MASSAVVVRTSAALAVACAILTAAVLSSRDDPAPQLPPGEGRCSGASLPVGVDAHTSDPVRSDSTQDIAVTIHAPSKRGVVRPLLSLAIVIDRSMTGDALARVYAAAGGLIDRLGDGDAFTVVAYASGGSYIPIAAATDAAKRKAHEFLGDPRTVDGGCMSCGLIAAADQLASSPIHGVQRIVVITNRTPTAGSDLAELAATIAARGISISTLGVGDGYDQVAMPRLAEVGHGNFYALPRAADVDAALARELSALAHTVASAVELHVAAGRFMAIAAVDGRPTPYSGCCPMDLPIGDLRGDDVRPMVVRVHVPSGMSGRMLIARVSLTWTLTDAIDDGATMRTGVIATIAH
jgi:Ca-activated chloride channel family protein